MTQPDPRSVWQPSSGAARRPWKWSRKCWECPSSMLVYWRISPSKMTISSGKIGLIHVSSCPTINQWNASMSKSSSNHFSLDKSHSLLGQSWQNSTSQSFTSCGPPVTDPHGPLGERFRLDANLRLHLVGDYGVMNSIVYSMGISGPQNRATVPYLGYTLCGFFLKSSPYIGLIMYGIKHNNNKKKNT